MFILFFYKSIIPQITQHRHLLGNLKLPQVLILACFLFIGLFIYLLLGIFPHAWQVLV